MSMRWRRRRRLLGRSWAPRCVGPPRACDAQPPTRRRQVWRAGHDALDECEELEYDPSAYDCLHDFQLDWPSLSFDFLRDELGAQRTAFPHALYLVAGSQADELGSNTLSVVRLTQLSKMRRPGGEESESESSRRVPGGGNAGAPARRATRSCPPQRRGG